MSYWKLFRTICCTLASAEFGYNIYKAGVEIHEKKFNCSGETASAFVTTVAPTQNSLFYFVKYVALLYKIIPKVKYQHFKFGFISGP